MELTTWQKIWMPLVLTGALMAGGVSAWALGTYEVSVWYPRGYQQKKPAVENLNGYEELKILMDIRKELHYDELRAKVADLERRVEALEESCDAGPSF